MEMWELLKSLFSEVNFSFWNASVVQTPQYSLADTDHVQSRSLEVWWAESGGSAPSRSVKAEEWIPSRAGWAAQASLLPSYTSEKPHSWRVNSVWSMCDDFCFLFVFLRGWGTLQLVVMRPTGCGERGRESWEAFTCCRLLLWHLNRHTNAQNMQKWLGEDPAAVSAWFTRNVFIALFKRLRLLCEEVRSNSSLFCEYIVVVVVFFCF